MAITLTLVGSVTDEDLLELSERNPGYQFERTAEGKLVVTPTGSEGGRREAQLALQLGNWADRDGRGVAFSSATGFRLPDGAVRAPDASWVRRERWEALQRAERRKFAPLCPDAVFELVSEHQTLGDLRDKTQLYLANGARIAMLIDADGRAVEVYRPGRQPEVHVNPEAVALSPDLPGFVLNMAPLLEG